jgi:hypothetical protein
LRFLNIVVHRLMASIGHNAEVPITVAVLMSRE